MLSHADAFTQRSLYTQTPHRSFHTQMPLHPDAFTKGEAFDHSVFYT